MASSPGRLHRPHRRRRTRSDLRTRVGVSRHGRHPPAVLHAGDRADGAVQRRALEGRSIGASRRPVTRRARGSGSAATCFSPTRASAAALMHRYRAGAARRRARAAAVARRRARARAGSRCSTTSSSACSGPDDGYATPREVLQGFRTRPLRRGVEYRARTRSSASTSSGGRVTRRHGSPSGDVDRHAVVVNAAGPWAGRVAATGRPRRAGRADAADAVSRDAAAPLAASLSDGDRSGRRALAPRRSRRRPAIPIASSSRSPSGTSRRARTSRPT